MEAGFLQRLDERGKVVDPKHDTVPSSGLLRLTVRHRPRSGCLWAAEQNLRVAERDAGEGGKLLMFEREAEVGRVERDGASHVFDLISDAMHTLHERMRCAPLLSSRVGFLSRGRHLFISCRWLDPPWSWCKECARARTSRPLIAESLVDGVEQRLPIAEAAHVLEELSLIHISEPT